jgi:hypothetical protein
MLTRYVAAAYRPGHEQTVGMGTDHRGRRYPVSRGRPAGGLAVVEVDPEGDDLTGDRPYFIEFHRA